MNTRSTTFASIAGIGAFTLIAAVSIVAAQAETATTTSVMIPRPTNPAISVPTSIPLPVPPPTVQNGIAELSIREIGKNKRREVNIKNALVTNIMSSTSTQEVYCIKAPCPPITKTHYTLTIESMGIPFTVELDTQTKTLNYARKPIQQTVLNIGDRMNIYGWQQRQQPSVIEAEIVRVVAIVKTAIEKDPSTRICIQVLATAKNPATGEVRTFPTPCDIPQGWVKIEDTASSTEPQSPKIMPKYPGSTTTPIYQATTTDLIYY